MLTWVERRSVEEDDLSKKCIEIVAFRADLMHLVEYTVSLHAYDTQRQSVLSSLLILIIVTFCDLFGKVPKLNFVIYRSKGCNHMNDISARNEPSFTDFYLATCRGSLPSQIKAK